MDDLVNLNQILHISDTIIHIQGKEIENVLLKEDICNKHNVVLYKKKIKGLFEEIKTAKYLYQFPKDNIKITYQYQDNGGVIQKPRMSSVEKIMDKQIDGLIHLTDLYNKIIEISYNLTHDESVYLVNAFLKAFTEEDIAEIIGISKTTLQHIKRSCIIKLYIGLEEFIIE